MREEISFAAIIGIAFVLLVVIVGGMILFSHALGKMGQITGPSNSSANTLKTGGPNSTTPNVITRHSEIGVGAELNNSIAAGFTVNLTTFYVISGSQCVRESISYCNNNEPSQFVCINSRYSGKFTAQRSKIYSNKSRACPLFVLAGNISCTAENYYCAVTDTYPGPLGASSSSNGS